MNLNNKSVAIIGGGPGGLTLARLLQLQKINVTVYERDLNRQVRQQGATLDLHTESGLEALRRAGLLDEFYKHYRPHAGKMRVTDKYAHIKIDDHDDALHNEDRPEIDRGPLREILLDSLDAGTIMWDSHFTSMEAEGEGWRLHFRNNVSAYADFVVASDGANSRIRPYITSIVPVYSGITIIEGGIYEGAKHAPGLWDLVKNGKLFSFGDEQSLIITTKGDGSLSFYTGCKVPENWVQDCEIDFTSKESVYRWFIKTFGNWDPVYQELFNGEKFYYVPRPQYHFPLDQQWKSLNNLTMLGDAAHRMPPYAGEGVNMAMQDAMELAACLISNEYATLLQAIQVYEAGMLKRASAVTELTLVNTEMLHSEDPVGSMMRMFAQ